MARGVVVRRSFVFESHPSQDDENDDDFVSIPIPVRSGNPRKFAAAMVAASALAVRRLSFCSRRWLGLAALCLLIAVVRRQRCLIFISEKAEEKELARRLAGWLADEMPSRKCLSRESTFIRDATSFLFSRRWATLLSLRRDKEST